MQYTYNFPPNNRAGGTFEELKHAAGEIVEAMAAPEGKEKVVEILDSLECLEQSLRNYDDETVNDAYEAHYMKNKARGDYD